MQFEVTAFCRHIDGTGTTWIDFLTFDEPVDIEHIKKQAAIQCATDWELYKNDDLTELDDDSVVCIGVAAGIVTLIEWEDFPYT